MERAKKSPFIMTSAAQQEGELAVLLMDWQRPPITTAPGLPIAFLMSPLPAPAFPFYFFPFPGKDSQG